MTSHRSAAASKHPWRAHDFHRFMRDMTHEADAGRLSKVEAATRLAKYMQAVLRCAHVTFWYVRGEVGQRVMRQVVAYDGLKGEAAHPNLEFPESGGQYFNTLLQSGCFVCNDAFSDPRLSSVRDTMLVRYNLHALLSASFNTNGQTWGILTCTDIVPRKWTSAEITALRQCAGELSAHRLRREGLEQLL
jgi:GAF domain-containing protein